MAKSSKKPMYIKKYADGSKIKDFLKKDAQDPTFYENLGAYWANDLKNEGMAGFNFGIPDVAYGGDSAKDFEKAQGQKQGVDNIGHAVGSQVFNYFGKAVGINNGGTLLQQGRNAGGRQNMNMGDDNQQKAANAINGFNASGLMNNFTKSNNTFGKATPGSTFTGDNYTPSSDAMYAKDGAYITGNGDSTPIEIEGSELEVKNGKIYKDAKNFPKHSSETGGPQYNAKKGNIIIPHKQRDQYLNGDQITRKTLEMNLVNKQNKEDKYNSELEDMFDTVGYGDGGKIHIKPENKGKFTSFAKSHGMGVQEAARHVLAHKDKYSSTIIKRANFARNASKFKHGNGGSVEYAMGGGIDEQYFTTDEYGNQVPNDAYNYQVPPVTNNSTPQKSVQPTGYSFNKGSNGNYGIPENTGEFSTPELGNTYKNPNNNNYKQYGEYAAMAAPVAYNIGMGLFSKPDYLNNKDYQNPYESKIMNLMSKRDIDLSPIQNRIRMEKLQALKNVRSSGVSSGQYLSNAANIYADTQNSVANAEMQAQQAKNQLRGEEANSLAGLGEYNANRKLQVEDINAQRKGAKQRFLSTGLSQVGDIGQGMRKEDNQLNYLNQMLDNYEYDPSTKKFKYKVG